MQVELQRMRMRSYFVSMLLLPVYHMDMQPLRQTLRHLPTNQYHEDIINMIETWFEKVRDIANNEGISDVKTETLH